MRKCRPFALVFFSAALTTTPAPVTADTEGALIKGTADFVLDRAYDNYMYVVQLRIASNPVLQEYFSETLRTAQAGDLRFLLTHKDLWKNAIEKDLKNVAEKEFESKIEKKIFSVIQGLCAVIKTPESIALKCDGISKQKNLTLADLRELIRLIRDNKQGAQGQTAPVAFAPPGLFFNPEWLPLPGWLSIGREENDRVAIATRAVGELIDGIDRVITACQNLKSGAYTKCVVEITGLFKFAARAEYAVFCRSVDLGLACPASVRKLGMYYEDEDLSDFLQYALFFAQMADAEDPSTVKALLKSVTMPSVSFGIKREPFRTRYLVSSYLGGGFASTRSTQKSQTEGIFAAPVGFEISQGLYSGNSISVLLSPIDLGYPLRLKLNDNNTTVRFSDIVAPGVYVFYGLRGYPIAIGGGYTRVRDPENPSNRILRINLLVAFDMPLFTLH